MELDYLEDPVCRLIWSSVDRDFYRTTYPDVADAAIEPVRHYAHTGWREGRDPAPWFSTQRYLDQNADVRAAGVNPFLHYLRTGYVEGRQSFPSGRNEDNVGPENESGLAAEGLAQANDGADGVYQIETMAAEFNTDYYLGRNPDVAEAGVDALEHFAQTGWRERRDPNPFFSVESYLDLNQDVRDAGINPFFHFLAAGRKEGRIGKPKLGFRYEVIQHITPIKQRVSDARTYGPKRDAAPASQLRARLRSMERTSGRRLYLSVSHDDFTKNFGGVQLILTREAEAIRQAGWDHLHLFPSLPLLLAEVEDNDPLTGVLVNGALVGFFRASTIKTELARFSAGEAFERQFAIHSILGHNAKALVQIIKAAGGAQGWFWLHDYASVCAGFNLMRNDVEFCGGPPPDSQACMLCVYGESRAAQVAAHKLLFDELDLAVAAPSKAALEVWAATTKFSARELRVHEHGKLTIERPGRGKSRPGRAPGPLKVAFLGLPVVHKGWAAFRDLALKFGDDPRYSFYHLGKQPELGLPMVWREVVVGAGNLDLMTETVAALSIDIAVIWSLWPETFCVAAYEAIIGGASVITHVDSGNVARLVDGQGFGAVLPSEEALETVFESGEVIELVRSQTRPAFLGFQFGSATADLISAEAQ